MELFYLYLKIGVQDMDFSDEFPFHNKFDWAGKVFLGQGSYGKVFKAKSKVDGQFYAIKQMNMEEFNHDPTLMASLKGEISVQIDVNSEYTVKMIEFKIQQHFTYMVLEICDSDLRKELTSHKFTEAECVHVFEEIMLGFQILVSKGYIHRDIKPANVLVKDHHYKVADFGFACKADILGKKKLNDICGTPIYMAPQLLSNQPYTAKSDIWSLGLMLYEMIFGYPPWPCRTLDQYLQGIYNRPLSFPFDARIGENTKDFLKRTLMVDESRRIGWTEVFDHPLIKHKQVGKNIQPVAISPYLREILIKLQADVKKHNLNLRDILNKYKADVIPFDKFTIILREVDLTMTTYEAKALYQFLDKEKTGLVKWEAIKEGIARIDYRNSDNVFERKLDDLVAILRARKEDPRILFESIDLNKSGTLDWSEFSKFLTAIAPCYTRPEMLQLFQLFDADRSGLISKNEFLQFLTSRLPSGKQHIIQEERANRNLQNFASYLKWSGISGETILKIADGNGDSLISQQELGALLGKLNFKVSEEEVFEIFSLINKNGDASISLDQLMALIK